MIPVAEQFYSIQGEGPYAGTPAVFLRLVGCNLKCGLAEQDTIAEFEKGQDPTAEEATWICDTIDVWRSPDKVFSSSDLAEDWAEKGWSDKLMGGAHIVITGGEPTLRNNQKAMMEFLPELGFMPFVEVETNGTIVPNGEFDDWIQQYNVSVKLANSGMSYEQRVNPEAMQYYSDVHHAKFKFVVSSPSDMDEIEELVERYNVDPADVFLMPAGQRREQLEQTYPVVAEICKETSFRFSPRLHVNIWDLQTGV